MEVELLKKDNLIIHLFYDKKSLIKDTLMVKNLYLTFPGLPNFINGDFFENLLDKDTAFMHIYYYGYWLSGLSFTQNNCIKSVEDGVRFAQNKIGKKTFDSKFFSWDYENLNIMGYSFGAFPILRAKLGKSVNSIKLFAPLIYLDRSDVLGILGIKETENFYFSNKSFLKFIASGYQNVLRGIESKEWSNLFGGWSASPLEIPSDFPAITIVHGTNDKDIKIEFSKYFQKKNSKNCTLVEAEGVGHNKDIIRKEFF